MSGGSRRTWKAIGLSAFSPLAGAAYYKNTMGTNSGDPNYASNLRAGIAREEWEDYKKRFQPKENQLLDIANNPQGFVQQQNTEALGAINKAYEGAMPQMTREYGRFGMTYTPDQKNELQRRLSNNQGLAQVQGLNTSTRLANDQVLGLMGGGTFQGNKTLINGGK